MRELAPECNDLVEHRLGERLMLLGGFGGKVGPDARETTTLAPVFPCACAAAAPGPQGPFRMRS
jgi:hypothetical protein